MLYKYVYIIMMVTINAQCRSSAVSPCLLSHEHSYSPKIDLPLSCKLMFLCLYIIENWSEYISDTCDICMLSALMTSWLMANAQSCIKVIK